jgi:hypothetical protein
MLSGHGSTECNAGVGVFRAGRMVFDGRGRELPKKGDQMTLRRSLLGEM